MDTKPFYKSARFLLGAALVVGEIVGVLGDIEFVRENLQAALDFLDTGVATVLVLLLGFGLMIWAIRRPPVYRVLSPFKRNRFGKALKTKPPREVSISTALGYEDSYLLGREIARLLTEAGWNITNYGSHMVAMPRRGVYFKAQNAMDGAEAQTQLRDAFNQIGLELPALYDEEWDSPTLVVGRPIQR